ncbi:MAG: ATP synthase F1 subunit delta [Bacteroidales bacterium]|jgi:F-type H+-transporting ATPase subunit delta|nr:ATP synthase F1 subunit delta [Bacteroidales bacterium]
MYHSQINVRYAKALFLLAREKKLVDEIKRDMEFILESLNHIPEINVLLQHPVIKTSRKRAVLNDLFAKKVNSHTLAFLLLVVKNKRENHLYGIMRYYVDLYRQFKGIQTAEITTALELSDQEREEIVTAIEDQFKATVELKQRVDEKIIGGLIIEIDYKQLDLSVAHSLNRLKRELLDFEISYHK